ncbi:dihydroorotate dehydrogenase B (NAD(+)), electron transfer subunit [Clostridium tepidiprofundi DSM 19306]|uniref:Dihydroorotate dehydrogenase B (NAD(+)), electron transfer subunit n=1 Tax=Clostridium tepidiprofundi DSM 19306 TaxID=1121338 RepID=A0A151B7F2_9CLOT|nr:sulfide/dihydroorotate dehydrogenase-like FAD/NAD-binding protein [Clostridium tepidiprofundi]KYH35733.1 dihydroorotate dehydrogenase B (NAD(+)), electron transfer subunit [Clostridium tepidiprofundi DSM 19306]
MLLPCPCHLAETGDCIICSQLQGATGCDCANWKGVCIYQEYIWNNKKAKSGRKYYKCSIIRKTNFSENSIILTIKAPEMLVNNLIYPGSFVFLRNPNTDQFYDFPISIMDADIQNSSLTFAIELKGIKTKKVNELKIQDELLVKGPFWNGVLGLRNINNVKNSVCLTIARGIGQAPLVPVLKKLYKNNNKIISILDKGNYNDNFIYEYLLNYDCEIIHCNTFENGKLTTEFKELLIDILLKNNIKLVHCSAADILNYNVMKIVENVSESLYAVDLNNINEIMSKSNPSIKFTCCNNAKMSCGEGICGCCTRKNKDHKLRRMCKMQTDPKYVLEGRRLF